MIRESDKVFEPFAVQCINNEFATETLTVGKRYIVVQTTRSSEFYFVRNDLGFIDRYMNTRFKKKETE